MCRLIESILIRFPLPAFYFDATDDNKWLVVDGLQRLSAIKKFVSDRLRLSNMEFLTGSDVSGKCYSELDRKYTRRMDECIITLYLIQPGTPRQVKYNIFRRINTGGIVLNDQEIRNAMAKPRERDFLNSLAREPDFIAMMGERSRRMKDQESILRFFAFFFRDNNNIPSISRMLDQTIDKIAQMTLGEQNELKELFHVVSGICYKIFGYTAFEKRSLKQQEHMPKNICLFEVWMVSIAKASREEQEIFIQKKDYINNAMLKLIENDAEFVSAITSSTRKSENIYIRYQRIENILKGALHD
jgi:Ca2+-binding EF-hand superfamily protein